MPRRLPSRPRLLAIGNWARLCLCVAIAGVWLASGWYWFRWVCRESDLGIAAELDRGRVGVSWGEYFRFDVTGPYGKFEIRPHPPDFGWGVEWHDLAASGVGSLSERLFPLWAPFLLTAAPTALLWWRSRHPKPGHCRCGYSLAGLEDMPCPECGDDPD